MCVFMPKSFHRLTNHDLRQYILYDREVSLFEIVYTAAEICYDADFQNQGAAKCQSN